jgi:integrase
VFPSGVRSFFHLRFVRGYPKRKSIGRFPDVSVEQARGKASEFNAAYSKWRLNSYQGAIPFEAKGDPTLEDVATQYVEKHIKSPDLIPEKAEKAGKFAMWQLGAYFKSWRKRKIGSIDSTDVVDLHNALAKDIGTHSANRAVQFLRAVINWSVEAKLWRGENPAAGIKLFPETGRKRYLEPNELYQFFLALRKEKNIHLRDFVKLAMWTGARRGDILSMRWENLSLDDNRWNVPDPKNRTPYQVALTPEAVTILRDRAGIVGDSPWVFPSRSRTGHTVDPKLAWHKLIKRAGITGLRIHDLRRTLGSYQAAQGTSMKIIGESLGHKSLRSTEVYAQINLDPVRASVMSATRTIIAGSKKKPKPDKPKLLTAGKS